MTTKPLCQSLFDIGAISIGAHPLKNGLVSPFYIDLRRVVSFPELLAQLAQGLIFKTGALKYDLICGVNYSGLPLATAFSLKSGTPMVLAPKERSPSTKKKIEGVFTPGQNCLVIEDVVTSGHSLLSTLKSLEEAGLQVTDTLSIIDREQGAKPFLKKQGYQLYSLYTLPEIIDQAIESHKITEEKGHEIKLFLKKNSYLEL